MRRVLIERRVNISFFGRKMFFGGSPLESVITEKDTPDKTEDCNALGFGTPAFGMLTKWFQATRLETRTKESNICASIWVANPFAQ